MYGGGDMNTKKPDVWLALCVIAGALVYLYSDLHMPVMRSGDPLGPRAFPALVGGGLLFAGALLLVETYRKARAEAAARVRTEAAPRVDTEAAPRVDTEAAPRRHDEVRKGRHQTVVLLAMVVWTALYYTAFEPVGYLVSTAVFLGGLLSYFHRGHYRTNLLVALGFVLIVDLVFSRLLNVPLPAGILSL
jgi:putative tricarboxylic transport membrane protein